MKKRMLALILAGVLSCNMGTSVLAADNAQAGEPTDVTTGITEEKQEIVPESEDVMDSAAASEDSEMAASMPDENYTGWWSDGSYDYYYVDGAAVNECIYLIEDSWYMFDYDGRLERDSTDYFWHEESDETRYYRSDMDGKLISGWYINDYGEKYYYSTTEYYQYRDTIFEDGGNLYYANYYGEIVVSDTICYDDAVYEADEDGVLTKKEVKTQWVETDGHWYYFVDGVPLKDQMYTIGGIQYYFYESGVMATSSFGYYDEETDTQGMKLAAKDGRVLNKSNTWHKEGELWYYFKEDGWIANNEFVVLQGKKYRLDYGGELVIGTFSLYDNELGTYVEYVTDASGAVLENQKTGWVQAGGKWYYYKDEYTLAEHEFLDIDGQRYFFDWGSEMQTGVFEYYGEYYFANVSGVVLKNQWISYKGGWYFADTDYTLHSDGVYQIGSQSYAFNYRGEMQTGDVQIYDSETGYSNYYLTDDSGAILTGKGWKYYNMHYYYTHEDGRLYRNQWVEGNYYVAYDGEMAIGTRYIDDGIYYFDGSGYSDKKDWRHADYKGWKLIDGYWYYHDSDGEPVTGLVEGNSYYIEDGVMQTNQLVYHDGKTYYVRHDGMVVKNGWHLAEHGGYYSDWVYANSDGSLVRGGWKTIGGKRYYFMDCAAVTGVYTINGKTEIFDENCVCVTAPHKGWTKINGGWYYFNPDGTLLRNVESQVIDGRTYYFYHDGMLKCDSIEVDDETKMVYYLDANGYSHTFKGWKQVHGEWYYTDANGKAVNGLQNIGGKYYYFYYGGHMAKGAHEIDAWDGWYFFNASGAYQNVQNGWVTEGDYWYYFRNGKLLRDGMYKINGAMYAFDYDGIMHTGGYEDFVFSENGAVIKNAWYQNPYGTWYYADAAGRYVYGQRTIGGKTYWFAPWGELIK